MVVGLVQGSENNGAVNPNKCVLSDLCEAPGEDGQSVHKRFRGTSG